MKSPQNSPKISEKRKKTTYCKPQNTEYRNISSVTFRFLHLAWQRWTFALLQPRQLHLHFCTPVFYPLTVQAQNNRCLSYSRQSCKIVFVARACNIPCILHQSCPMKTQHFTFTPMRNSVV